MMEHWFEMLVRKDLSDQMTYEQTAKYKQAAE